MAWEPLKAFVGRHRHQPEQTVSYDPELQYPVIRASICTGERVAGFKDRKTGAFHEIMLIRDQADLEEFMETYGLDDIGTEY
jgi:hypothetical protein